MWHLKYSFIEHRLGKACLWDVGWGMNIEGWPLIFSFYLSPWWYLCETSLPVRFPISASFTNWLPSGCLYCSEELPGVGTMLYTCVNSAFLFEINFFFTLSSYFLCYFLNFLLMNSPSFSNSNDILSTSEHFLGSTSVLEHILPPSFHTLPMPWLYRSTWISAFLK